MTDFQPRRRTKATRTHPTTSFPNAPRRAAIAIALLGYGVLLPTASCQSKDEEAAIFAETFDAHWERLRDDYPYFEFYGVDWEAERKEHRSRAVGAANATEFAWEMARLISALPDRHVSYLPSMETIKGRWSVPEIKTHMIEQRPFVISWPDGSEPEIPAEFADLPFAYPEIIAVSGEAPVGAAETLAAGPLGTKLELRLGWPDGSETDHSIERPDESNLPPPSKHLGDRWLVTGRVGSVGYMKVKTFDPEQATLGADGKMTTMLRAALRELRDTKGLIIDLQGNGGGLVAASDPFLGNLLQRTQTYSWGRSGGKKRIIRPRSPRYRGEVVALVNARSASGGEWAARILRDAGRATVVGERTAGAEAAVGTSQGPDGSVVKFSEWPMTQPGVTPFQGTGIELDHDIPLTIEDARTLGLDEALQRVRRARLAKALEVFSAPASALDALVELAAAADR